MEERRLDGGINQVVQVGQTVRRTVGPWSASVHELLRYLEARGFAGAPRFLGIDQDGREILSLVPGETPGPMSGVLDSAAALLRRYHDVVEEWSPANGSWQVAPVVVGEPEVICHNDVAPWNLIARDSSVVAFVDWDTAAPGPRMWDLAYLAYTLVPLAAPENLGPMGWPSPTAVRERLARVRDAYGCTEEQWDTLLDTIPVRVRAAYDTMRIWASEGRPGWRAQWEQPEPWRRGAGYLRDLAYIETSLDSWKASRS
ncbi:aminoglycoside phosphotransferase family protein [Kribbella speibonae]|uniref:Aminoglycoside phosphotransferase family protein n=1 Tax=Kribbella speibonae TaxID=1572660 RepID=A0ABY2ABY9_9ACTN|nr:aminoglycoside phosphotransferase family protein [Kribbella speibonae]TCC26593.1 aminoglycoside phosphotransferase family protein [Kribbella speibonae]